MMSEHKRCGCSNREYNTILHCLVDDTIYASECENCGASWTSTDHMDPNQLLIAIRNATVQLVRQQTAG